MKRQHDDSPQKHESFLQEERKCEAEEQNAREASSDLR